MHWTQGLALVITPTLVWMARPWIKKINDYDERRIAEHEEKRDRRLAEKAARKAAKKAVKGPRYTSATVVQPPRLPDLRSNERGGGDGTGPSDRG